MPRTQGTGTVEYAVWKGEEFLTLGTAQECALVLGVSTSMIYSMCNKSKKQEGPNRLYVLKIEEEDEE